MTWPELPPSYFVTTVAGATLLVDRGPGRSARLDPIAALVLQHRESFADRDDAAAAMSELFERPQSEVDAGLADFDHDLAVVAQSASPWEPPTYAPVEVPGSAPAATWTFDALGQSDVFFTKIRSDGKQILYSTYLGGEGLDTVNAIYIEPSGTNIYLVGGTTSARYPTTPNAYQNFLNGGQPIARDGFISKINANGQLVYSTFLGAMETTS